VLWMEHTHGRGLLWGWWWPVGSKLVLLPDVSTSPRNYGYGWLLLKILVVCFKTHILLPLTA
jgi:hypothetical protein